MSSATEQLQSNELEALQSIFGPDFAFEDEGPRPAWHRLKLPTFRIRIDTTQYDDSMDARRSDRPHLSLRVQLPYTYPRTEPDLQLVDAVGISKNEILELQTRIAGDSRSMIGSEMIYDVVENIRSYLQLRSRSVQQASLDEERIARLAREQAAQTQASLNQESATERQRRQFKTELSVEVAATQSHSSSTPIMKELPSEPPALRRVTFRTPIVLPRHGFLRDLHISQPLTSNDTSICVPWNVALDCNDRLIYKEVRFAESARPGMIESIENFISQSVSSQSDKIRMTSGANLGHQITLNGETVVLQLLQPRASFGSLQDLLNCVGSITSAQARQWLLDILDQLSIAHRHGILHGRILATKVLLFHTNGRTVASLADFGYSYLARAVATESSAILLESCPMIARHDDIAHLGLLALHMISGKRFDHTLQLHQLPQILGPNADQLALELIRSMLQPDVRQRPTATDLIAAPFLRYADRLSSLQATQTREIGDLSRYKHDFEEILEIGRGAFGTVVKARNRLDGRLYAIKKVQSDKESRVLREVSGLARLNHAGIVRYFGAWLESDIPQETTTPLQSPTNSVPFGSQELSHDSSVVEFGYDTTHTSTHSVPGHRSISEVASESKETYQLPRTLFIQMEFCGGNTLRRMIDERRIGKLYWQYFAQIVDAVQYVHSQGLIHRDLKPANIFIDSDGQLKLGDFGLAAEGVLELVNRDHSLPQHEMTADIGTFFYSAPELLLPHPKYADKVDIYALGIIFVELLCEWTTAMGRINAIRALRQREVNFPDSLTVATRRREQELLSKLLSHEPSERPTAQQLSHQLPTVKPAQMTENTLRLLEHDEAFKHALLGKLFSMKDDVAEYLFLKPERLAADQGHFRVHQSRLSYEVRRIFELHAACPRPCAILYPSSISVSKTTDSFLALDRNGVLLQLRGDLQVAFARDVARSDRLALPHRSYCVANVYQAGAIEPESHLKAAFDIVGYDDVMDRYAVVRVAFEVYEKLIVSLDFKGQIEIGHASILRNMLNTLKIPLPIQEKVSSILYELSIQSIQRSYQSWRDALIMHISEASIRYLFLLHEEMKNLPLDDYERRLERIMYHFPSVKTTQISEEVKQFKQGMASFAIDLPLIYNPFVVDVVKDELHFCLVATDNAHRSYSIVTGGDLAIAIAQFTMADDVAEHKVFGLTIDIDQVTRISEHNVPGMKVDVVINSFAHEPQARSLLVKLWDAGLVAAACRDMDSALAYAQENEARFLLSYKDKKGQKQIIRVRSLHEKDATSEHDLAEVAQHLRAACDSSVKNTSNAPNILTEPDLIIVSTDERKHKHQMLSNKALQRLKELVKELQSGDIPILICDLDAEQMGYLKAAVNGERSAITMLSHAQAAAFKAEVSKLRYDDVKRAIAYSFRSTEMVLLDL